MLTDFERVILPVGDVANRCHELDSYVKYTCIDRFFD